MKKLKDYVNVLVGYQIRSKVKPVKGGGVRIVQMKDVDPETGFDPNQLDAINLSGKKEPDWLQEGDVLFVGRGYNNFAVLVHQQKERTIAAPQFFVLKADRLVNPAYLTWYLNHHRAQRYFKQMSQSTSLPNITRSVLENCPFVLPEMELQNKLAKLAELIKRERQLSQQILEKRRILMEKAMDQSLESF